MRRAIAVLLAACLLASHPAGAQTMPAEAIRENEPLVMRLIFEDCLGYVRHGRTPFKGLATRPASPAAAAQIPGPMFSFGPKVELLSPRYVAAWGSGEGSRYCSVLTVLAGNAPSGGRGAGPGLLGVRPDGFIARVTARAVAHGITERSVGEEFSPTSLNSWYDRETGHNSGPLRPISFSLIPTGNTGDGGLVDAGLIVMGGPPQGRPKGRKP